MMESLNNFFLAYSFSPSLFVLYSVYISLIISFIIFLIEEDVGLIFLIHIFINIVYVFSFVDESYVLLTRICIFFIPYLVLILIGAVVFYALHRMDREC